MGFNIYGPRNSVRRSATEVVRTDKKPGPKTVRVPAHTRSKPQSLKKCK